MSNENEKQSNLAVVIVVALVVAGIVFLLWVTTDADDDPGGVNDPEAAAEHDGKSTPEQERFAVALKQLDAVSGGGKLQDVCEGTFRWVGGGDPMCLVLHDVGSTRYEVHDEDDRAWFEMSFYYRDRTAREVAFNDIWNYVRTRDPEATHTGDRFNFTHRGQEGLCDLTLAGHTDVFCKVKLR